jgi:hypothetical protein
VLYIYIYIYMHCLYQYHINNSITIRHTLNELRPIFLFLDNSTCKQTSLTQKPLLRMTTFPECQIDPVSSANNELIFPSSCSYSDTKFFGLSLPITISAA